MTLHYLSKQWSFLAHGEFFPKNLDFFFSFWFRKEFEILKEENYSCSSCFCKDLIMFIEILCCIIVIYQSSKGLCSFVSSLNVQILI